MTQEPGQPLDPVLALKQIVFALEAAAEPGYRVRAFQRAAKELESLPAEDVRRMAKQGTLKSIPGVGDATERAILEALAGKTPAYLEKLHEQADATLSDGGRAILNALKGDCHTHSDWSDGYYPLETMMEAAIALGREYVVLTDHSPRLTIASGLSPERLEQQLDLLEELNAKLAPFRILSGIECDINLDGTLDQEERLLKRLDVVVGSVHSKLRQDAEGMTARMLAAIENPYLDILGHCTGRIVVGRGRPESQFDHDAVFAACARYDKAVEINSRPERVDPPDNLIKLALEKGCKFAIDTDAHAPAQLNWLRLGSERAAQHGIPAERIVNTKDADGLIVWCKTHDG
jgi:putative hydrolase